MECLECKRLGRMCRTCRVASENAALRAALAPFVKFIDAWDAKPINRTADEFYGIHTGTEWEASLKLSDLRKAREVTKGTTR